ncbi:MAG: geranylgeranylglycerol-phosphate geranylgeranyltransferase [Candidatus Odinarchaeum yellowstonii]|uniref:Geranylgeranylglycerol-phosphate geranylgeranyltransferase n=1 Tax=Odinarchaeota yellowstonii (strain LCB_4) TaxID=1841599 RepID=A0AAF0D1I8_ODILC|nr:MAG: geranylgeranylglycerol-phosphate geranylgeranyltransferase [Candidatus Odinarchaeum yellowstonii]
MTLKKEKIKAIIEIMRPSNVIFGSITTTISVLTVNEILRVDLGISLSSFSLATFIALSYFTYFSIAIAGNIVNDIFDIEVDRVNRPDRPLPSGRIKVNEAKMLTVIFWVTGVILAFLTNMLGGVIAIAFSIIGLLYAAKGKVMGLIGNFMVSFSFSFGLLYGALIVYYQLLGLVGVPPIIWLYFITAFMVLQGREIIKGIEDIEGDAVRGVQTIARKYGVKKAAKISQIFNIVGMISFTSALILSITGITSLPKIFFSILYVPGMLCVGGSTLLIYSNPESGRNQRKASLLDKLGAFLGLLAFLIGVV